MPIPAERASEVTRMGAEEGEPGGFLSKIFSRPQARRAAPQSPPADFKWDAMQQLLKEAEVGGGSGRLEDLPEAKQENPVIEYGPMQGQQAKIWNGITGTLMTPAEWLDFKTVAMPSIYAGQPYDPEGQLQLRSMQGAPEAFMRAEPVENAGQDVYGSGGPGPAQDRRFRTRIQQLLGAR